MEESVDICLFCWDKIIPYSLSSQEGNKTTEDSTSNSNIPNFQELCNVLGITFTDDHLKQLSNVPTFCTNTGNASSKTCEKFLCLCCFEMVDTLAELFIELKEIEAKISSVTGKIRNVIIKPSAKGSGTQGRRRGRSKRISSSLELCEAFQTLVKESQNSIEATVVGGKDQIGNSPQSAGWNQKKKGKSVRNSQVVAVVQMSNQRGIDVEDNAVMTAVKIEAVDEEDEDVMEDVNNFDHFDDIAEEVKVSTITEMKVDAPNGIEGAQETVDRVDQQVSSLAVKEEKRKPIVTRSRRGTYKNPTAANDLDSEDTPKRKKSKIKASLPAPVRNLTCHICNLTFLKYYQYYTHRKTHAPRTMSEKSLNITTHYTIENDRKVVTRVCAICDHKVRGRQLTRFLDHMLSHENSVDPSSSPHPCDMCDKQFGLKLNLDLHKICRHNWHRVNLKCEICGNCSSKSQEELVTHLKSHGNKITTHCCKSCPMVCTSLDKILTHMTKHSVSRRLFCPECTWFFSTSLKELYKHCHDAHPELKEAFKCDRCQKSFQMPSSLRLHRKRTHGIGDDNHFGDFVCTQCNNGKVYKTKVSLESHIMYSHGDETKRHKCDQCEKSFNYKSQLHQHVEEKHETVRYPCPHCPKSYKTSTDLNYHMRIHTGEGLYTCNKCGKQFTRSSQLKTHSITHLEKNELTKCVCDVCGKEFSGESRLRQHKYIHDEKKLKCQYCDMTFQRKDHLRGHLRTHTGERPFVCPVCTKGFNRRDILIVHMKMHGYSYEEAAKEYDKHVEHLKQENLIS